MIGSILCSSAYLRILSSSSSLCGTSKWKYGLRPVLRAFSKVRLVCRRQARPIVTLPDFV